MFFSVVVLVFSYQYPQIALAYYTPNPGVYETNFKEERKTEVDNLLIVCGVLSLLVVILGMTTITRKDRKITALMTVVIAVIIAMFTLVI